MIAGIGLGLTLVATGGAITPGRDAAASPRWSGAGHRVVAQLAATRLSPAVAAQVTALLGGQTMAAVSNWADSIRETRTATGPWHYVNVPITDSVYRPDQVCPRQCVISALETQLAILADRSLPHDARAEALRFVIHLVGDMHMPLHVGDRGDRGGNDLSLTWRGRRSNLHSLWDTGLITAMGLDDAQLLTDLEALLATRGDAATLAAGSIREWAMQSHNLARDVAYAFLPADLAVGDEYFATVRPTVELQLVRAGVRLATVLERALGDDK